MSEEAAIIGSAKRPIELAEPMKIARAFMLSQCMTPAGRCGIWYWRGSFLVWVGNRWVTRTKEVLSDLVFRWGENVHCMVPTTKGFSTVRWAPTPSKVDDVVGAIVALARAPWEKLPVWTSEFETLPAPDYCIGFNDKVVCVEKGEMKVVDRDERWLDPAIVPCDWETASDAECPVWEKAINDWSLGKEAWKQTLQQFVGYVLTPNRRHAKFLLMYGATRGGKGVITRVVRMLVGEHSFWSTSMREMAGTFGMDGAERAKVLAVNEVGALDWNDASGFAVNFKNILGEDPISVNVKYQRQIQNVVCRAAPLLSSNEIPHIANKGDSISSKMLILPFWKSFREKPDLELTDKLQQELPGIARWAVEGVLRLERERTWPVVDGALEVMDTFRGLNSPLDLFLQSCFVKDPNGFVPNHLLVQAWQEYRVSNKVKDDYARNMLPIKLELDTSWGLQRDRKSVGGVQLRGLRGLGMLKKQMEG
jgi:putative DNA primase/helicase